MPNKILKTKKGVQKVLVKEASKISKKKPSKNSKIIKSTAKKVTVKKKEKVAGRVIHYFRKIKVAVVKVSDSLKVGDRIRIVGGEKEFIQPIKSMQIDYKEIKKAEKGKKIGLKVKSGVREGYKIYKGL